MSAAQEKSQWKMEKIIETTRKMAIESKTKADNNEP